MTHQTFCHRKILFAAVSLQQHFRPECLIHFCHDTTFTVKRNRPRCIGQGGSWREKRWSKCAMVVGPRENRGTATHRQTDTLPHWCSQCCKLTHTLILSKLSYDKGIVRFLWLPQMGLPDLRDDVIGFFERLRGEKERAVKSLALK